jgi:actin-related protein 5
VQAFNASEQNTLQAEGFDDDEALDEAIKKLESDLKKARKKDADGDDGGVVSL